MSNIQNNIGGPTLPDASALTLEDHLVECVQQGLAVRERAWLVGTRTDAQLRKSGDAPILTVGQMPEVNSVVGLEIGLGHFPRLEVTLADNLRAVHLLRPQGMSHHVVGVKAEQEVGI